MKDTTEKIKVHIKIVKGVTTCICMCSDKRCSRNCPVDVVTRGKYFEWEKTMNNRFGR